MLEGGLFGSLEVQGCWLSCNGTGYCETPFASVAAQASFGNLRRAPSGSPSRFPQGASLPEGLTRERPAVGAGLVKCPAVDFNAVQDALSGRQVRTRSTFFLDDSRSAASAGAGLGTASRRQPGYRGDEKRKHRSTHGVLLQSIQGMAAGDVELHTGRPDPATSGCRCR